MPRKPHNILFILLPITVLLSLVLPNGLRSAVANNVWSVKFIKGGNSSDPPKHHHHAGLLLAVQALKQEQVDLAAAYLAPLQNSSEPLVLNAVAQTKFLQGDHAGAIQIWNDLGEWFMLEQTYKSLDKPENLDAKILALQAASALFPQRYQRILITAKLDKAKVLVAEGNDAAAIEIYLQLIEQFPGEPRSYAGLAQAYMRTGQTELAFQTIRDGWPHNTGNAQFLVVAANIYEETGKVELAVFFFQQALKADSNNNEAKQGLERLSGADE